MDTNTIEAFITVAEQKSFSRAAEKLFITQPAVSKRIAALEQDIGAALFDRIGHVIELTQAGRTMLPRARQILDEIDAARLAVNNLADEVSGVLRIGISHHIGMRRAPGVLRAFAQRYPLVDLNIKFLGSEEAVHTVEQGHLEFALATLPAQPPEILQMETIWTDSLAVVTSPDHPLSGSKQLALADILAYPALLPTPETYTRQLVDSAFTAKGDKIAPGIETNNLETIKMMVSLGLGWSVLPLTMLDATIVQHSIAGMDFKRNLGVLMHPKRTLSNAAEAMIGLLREAAEAPLQLSTHTLRSGSPKSS